MGSSSKELPIVFVADIIRVEKVLRCWHESSRGKEAKMITEPVELAIELHVYYALVIIDPQDIALHFAHHCGSPRCRFVARGLWMSVVYDRISDFRSR